MSFKYGTLPNGTPQVIEVARMDIPGVVTLSSVAAGRLVRFSTDGGINFFTPTTDTPATTAAQVVVTFSAHISHIELTGSAADAWNVR